MSISQYKIKSNRRKEKALLLQTFSSVLPNLTYKQIQRQRATLGEDIIDNFVEIGRTDSQSTKVVQCRSCGRLLARPRRHYNNLRRHLTSGYHKLLLRNGAGRLNEPEAALDGGGCGGGDPGSGVQKTSTENWYRKPVEPLNCKVLRISSEPVDSGSPPKLFLVDT